ncbi:hypothetical protein ACIFQM_23235 [Paenibacillus sp. NRS-1782]|uniref:hypothetical protein n=1 Tax=unclassified Paenibacillus TaxID=185978 RepID=UPI003D265939
MAADHCYRCVVEFGDIRMTFPVYSPRQLTKDELRSLAIEQAVQDANDTGHNVTAADMKPIGFKYEGVDKYGN